MKYVAILQRNAYFNKVKQPKGKVEDVTIGALTLTDENGKILFECATLENGAPSTDKSGLDKRIVARDYKLKWHNSTKNESVARQYPQWRTADGRSKAPLLYTPELPNFESRYILIHAGNYAQDTEGCILLGEKGSGKGGVIANSAMTCHAFMRTLDIIGIENVTLRVIENPNENTK